MIHFNRRSWLGIIFLVVTAAGAYGLLPQLNNFGASLQAAKQAHIGDVALSLGAVLIGYGLAAATYSVLALRPLRYGPTLLVELAGLLVNRVLPAGIGGLGLNFAYLRAQKHTGVEASAVVSLNNILGFAGHAFLTVILLIMMPRVVEQFHIGSTDVHIGAVVAIGLIVVFAVLQYRAAHHQNSKLAGVYHQVLATLNLFKHRPGHLLTALLLSVCLTLSNVLCLWFCCQAIGLSCNFVDVFIVFSVGVVAGTATPTPGGLGAVEAGIVGGLVALHVPAATALAATLIYRLVSFWLGLIIGLVALYFVRRLKFISTAHRKVTLFS